MSDKERENFLNGASEYLLFNNTVEQPSHVYFWLAFWVIDNFVKLNLQLLYIYLISFKFHELLENDK
jgi:hypothetical protein